jgi:glycerol-3-phosphate dehydrogenase
MVMHLDDLLRRRIPLLILAKITPDELNNLAQSTAKILAWDAKKTDDEIKRCLQKQSATR